MNRAIFLDRDGVIIENVDAYVRSWSDVTILPGAVEALSRLCHSSYKIIIVTNQSVVGRGIITLGEAQSIQQRLVQFIRSAGGRVDGIYICPHSPEDACDCRKPKPGLLLQAASEHAIDLGQSIMVGDALTDLRAGQNAGIGANVLVKTGRGAAQSALPEARDLAPFRVYDRLADVIEAICSGLLS